jgi:hypothetical protein
MSGSRHSPEDSFGFKLYGITMLTVFVIGIFHPQYSSVVHRVLFHPERCAEGA